MNFRENVVSLTFLWVFGGAISFHTVLPSPNSAKWPGNMEGYQVYFLVIKQNNKSEFLSFLDSNPESPVCIKNKIRLPSGEEAWVCRIRSI